MDNFLRVTDVIKPFSGIEFVDPEILSKAANKGSEVHDLIEQRLKTSFPRDLIEPDLLPYIQSFDLFWDDHSHNYENCTMELEKRFFDDDLKITGKVDAIFWKPGRTYVVDWKTSSKFHKHFYLQGAAYQHLMTKEGYENVDEVTFVLLKKGKKPVLHKDTNPKKSWDLFLKCLELYKYFDMEFTRRKND